MPRARQSLILEQKIRRLEDQEKSIPGNPIARSIVERYRDAWNRGDLDAIFALFAEDARYEGVATQLNGRNNIRNMYERTFASGEGRGLVDDILGSLVRHFEKRISPDLLTYC
jgi:ketosteroid isomerase-like protein